MFSNLLDNPKLFRHLVEDLPVGIYIVDREGRIRFWNHGAEQLTGHLSHEVVGHVFEDVVQACDRRGNSLSGEHCPVTMTLSQRTAAAMHRFLPAQKWTPGRGDGSARGRSWNTATRSGVRRFCSKRRLRTARKLSGAADVRLSGRQHRNSFAPADASGAE